MKLLARNLRKQGKSLGEISQELGIAKSSLSNWCSDIALSSKQIEEILKKEHLGIRRGQLVAAENKRKERRERVDKYQLDAIHDVGVLSNRDLFMLGIGLYWAEGSKRHREVRIANTDPDLLTTFQQFMFQICKKTRLDVKYRIQINILHKDRYIEILKYWMNKFKVNEDSFSKPSYVLSKHKKTFEHRGTYFGTIHLSYKKSTNDSYLVLGYINAVKYWIQHHTPR